VQAAFATGAMNRGYGVWVVTFVPLLFIIFLMPVYILFKFFSYNKHINRKEAIL